MADKISKQQKAVRFGVHNEKSLKQRVKKPEVAINKGDQSLLDLELFEPLPILTLQVFSVCAPNRTACCCLLILSAANIIDGAVCQNNTKIVVLHLHISSCTLYIGTK